MIAVHHGRPELTAGTDLKPAASGVSGLPASSIGWAVVLGCVTGVYISWVPFGALDGHLRQVQLTKGRRLCREYVGAETEASVKALRELLAPAAVGETGWYRRNNAVRKVLAAINKALEKQDGI